MGRGVRRALIGLEGAEPRPLSIRDVGIRWTELVQICVLRNSGSSVVSISIIVLFIKMGVVLVRKRVVLDERSGVDRPLNGVIGREKWGVGDTGGVKSTSKREVWRPKFDMITAGFASLVCCCCDVMVCDVAAVCHEVCCEVLCRVGCLDGRAVSNSHYLQGHHL